MYFLILLVSCASAAPPALVYYKSPVTATTFQLEVGVPYFDESAEHACKLILIYSLIIHPTMNSLTVVAQFQ